MLFLIHNNPTFLKWLSIVKRFNWTQLIFTFYYYFFYIMANVFSACIASQIYYLVKNIRIVSILNVFRQSREISAELFLKFGNIKNIWLIFFSEIFVIRADQQQVEKICDHPVKKISKWCVTVEHDVCGSYTTFVFIYLMSLIFIEIQKFL